jgi:hypothetical protein
MVKYEKITLFDEFLLLLGPIISRLFTCSNEEKNITQKQQRVLVALVISLWFESIYYCSWYWEREKGIKKVVISDHFEANRLMLWNTSKHSFSFAKNSTTFLRLN